MGWKPVPGYEGLYEVSDGGEVRSCDRLIKTDIRHVKNRLIKGKPLKQNEKANGYKTVDLCKDGKVKTTAVHRIVAETFLPNPSGLRFVNHKDSDRGNNKADNLEWVTSSENRNHGIKHGYVEFTGRPVLCVNTGVVFDRVKLAAEWLTREYPDRVKSTERIAAQNIRAACKSGIKAYGFSWKFHEGSTTIPEGSRGKRPEMGDPSKRG